MYKQWEEQDVRAMKVKEEQRALKEFLRVQNEESKARKLQEKRHLVDEYVKITTAPVKVSAAMMVTLETGCA